MTARMKERAPDPKLLAEALREGGILTVYPARGAGLTRATLRRPTAKAERSWPFSPPTRASGLG